jgi:hypothetical protein
MQKIESSLFIIAMILALLPARRSSASPLQPGGSVFLANGKLIKVESFAKVLVQDEIIYGEKNGKEEEYRISGISRIRLLTDGVDYVFDNSKFTKKSGTLELTLKNGKKVVLDNAYFPEKTFTAKVRNSKTGVLEDEDIAFSLVKEIVFDMGPAIYKRCPSDNRLFPADYLYCPYDKTLLEKVIEKKQ